MSSHGQRLSRKRHDSLRRHQAVFGREFRVGRLGDRFIEASERGRSVARIGAVHPALQAPAARTPCLAVADADETVSRVQVRGGTVGVGPSGLPIGRAALVTDRGGTLCKVWTGRLVRDFGAWRHSTTLRLRLVNPDASDAATFCWKVVKWTQPRCCDARYEIDDVVVGCAGVPVARPSPDALEAAPDPLLRPRRQVSVTVEGPDKVISRAKAAMEYRGWVAGEYEDTAADRTMPVNPEGAGVTVLAPHPATAGSGR
ncbi:VOC family protein [Streptomyces sp. NPDC059262]|uniref:VOC family protein n=1 Tax=Streptomyces sp. NPDC059262 TaxID=3346797 RepID=UPI00367A8617